MALYVVTIKADNSAVETPLKRGADEVKRQEGCLVLRKDGQVIAVVPEKRLLYAYRKGAIRVEQSQTQTGSIASTNPLATEPSPQVRLYCEADEANLQENHLVLVRNGEIVLVTPLEKLLYARIIGAPSQGQIDVEDSRAKGKAMRSRSVAIALITLSSLATPVAVAGLHRAEKAWGIGVAFALGVLWTAANVPLWYAALRIGDRGEVSYTVGVIAFAICLTGACVVSLLMATVMGLDPLRLTLDSALVIVGAMTMARIIHQ